MDLAALLPRVLDIRRGSFLVAAIGILINPWKILNVRACGEVLGTCADCSGGADGELVHSCELGVRRVPRAPHGHHGVRTRTLFLPGTPLSISDVQCGVLSRQTPAPEAVAPLHPKPI